MIEMDCGLGHAMQIDEAILEGKQPATLELDDLMQLFSVEWAKQVETLIAN